MRILDEIGLEHCIVKMVKKNLTNVNCTASLLLDKLKLELRQIKSIYNLLSASQIHGD